MPPEPSSGEERSQTIDAARQRPSPQGQLSAADAGTLLFRGLLLAAASVAVAFALAAWINQLGPEEIDPTSPDASPPAVLVQPDR